MYREIAETTPNAPLIVSEDTEGEGPLEAMIRKIVAQEIKPMCTMIEQMIQILPGTSMIFINYTYIVNIQKYVGSSIKCSSLYIRYCFIIEKTHRTCHSRFSSNTVTGMCTSSLYIYVCM